MKKVSFLFLLASALSFNVQAQSSLDLLNLKADNSCFSDFSLAESKAMHSTSMWLEKKNNDMNETLYSASYFSNPENVIATMMLDSHYSTQMDKPMHDIPTEALELPISVDMDDFQLRLMFLMY